MTARLAEPSIRQPLVASQIDEIGQTSGMPALDDPYLSATELLAAYAAKTVSPVEYLEVVIARVEAMEPTLNAVMDRRYDEARVEAKASADRWAHGSAGALDGVPVVAKEEHPMIGRSWTQGSLAFADEVATVDHPIIERIQAAGGIIHIRSTTPEFCCAGFCHSRMWGITRNPWNTDFSPGGSSGGTGAALAAGYAPIGTGSDIGGSIRIPASLSGVAGFKPPWQRVPALPPYNLDQFCHDGPLARTVADCALLEDVIAGAHWRDPASLPNPPKVAGAAGAAGVTADVRGLRIAFCTQLGDWPLDPAVEANTRRVAASLEAAGAHVEEVTLPWTMAQIWDAAQVHFRTIMGAGIGAVRDAARELLSDYTIAFADSMESATLGFYEGLELEGELWEPLGLLFQRVDAFLCPTMATDGYRAGEPYLEGGMDVGGSHVRHHILGAMTLPFNINSRCPVVSVPSGRAANGVPTGVQVVGRPYDDAMAFRVAAAVESTGVGFTHPTWRPVAKT
jgi:Asp-tRNA(Asn)/Glu-tRNA(Gln) amidotransferase A subunit family amidase